MWAYKSLQTCIGCNCTWIVQKNLVKPVLVAIVHGLGIEISRNLHRLKLVTEIYRVSQSQVSLAIAEMFQFLVMHLLSSMTESDSDTDCLCIAEMKMTRLVISCEGQLYVPSGIMHHLRT
jgi:hypothetical protein